MAGVCFYFEPTDVDVWSGKNLDAWNYAIKAAGDIDKMIVVNRTTMVLTRPDAMLDFQVVDTMPQLRNAVHLIGPREFPGYPVESLWTFDHRVDWYCFGPALGWGNDVGRKVHVPQAGQGALHSVHIASVVMMHRFHVRTTSWQHP